MKPATRAPLVLATVAALACGGQMAGSETDGGSIGSKDGGATAPDSPSTLDSPADSPVVTLGTVLKAPLSGLEGGAPEILATGVGTPGMIALDSQSIYWVDLNTHTITKASKN